jgi:hypothetical protein
MKISDLERGLLGCSCIFSHNCALVNGLPGCKEVTKLYILPMGSILAPNNYICSSMDESHRYYFEQKKTGTKEYVY